MSNAKKCSKCNEIKSVDEFFTDPEMEDGLWSHCKLCQRIEVNKKKIVKYRRRYYKANREKILERRRRQYRASKKK